jgi:cytochrome c-type biogenesis protein CcmH/NrfG
MAIRVRLLLAGACAALTVAGCSAAATEDTKVEASTATATGMTASPGDGAKADPSAVSAEQKQQAQQLAEEAEKIMLDPALAPKDKYPKALGMFRDALEIDPDNALATKSITLIEDIYKGMGRPVPEPAR